MKVGMEEMKGMEEVTHLLLEKANGRILQEMEVIFFILERETRPVTGRFFYVHKMYKQTHINQSIKMFLLRVH